MASVHYQIGRVNDALRYYKLYAVELERLSDYNTFKRERFEKNLYQNEIKALNAKILELEDQVSQLKKTKDEFYQQNYWIFAGLKVVVAIALLLFALWAYKNYKKPKPKPEPIINPSANQAITDVIKATKDLLTKAETELDLADILVHQEIPQAEEFYQSNKSLRKKFLIHQPKKLAGGDGLYLSSAKGKTLIIAFDAPGNGAAGGLLSAQIYRLLTDLIKNYNLQSPSLILKQLEISLSNLFPAGTPFTNGINMAICLYDASLKTLTFAGANMDLYITYKQGQTTLLGVARSLLQPEIDVEYANTEIDTVRGKNFYLSTHGFWDQQGGFDNKPLGKRSFEKAIESLTSQPIGEHGNVLTKILQDWKGGNDQNDDILVFGFGF